MNKDDVLAKSREENQDEYVEKINTDSHKAGIIVLTAICIFFSITRVLNNGQPFFEFPAVLFAYIAGMNYYIYAKIKNKNNLISGFCFTFVFICLIILYFINM